MRRWEEIVQKPEEEEEEREEKTAGLGESDRKSEDASDESTGQVVTIPDIESFDVEEDASENAEENEEESEEENLFSQG